jgi:hypothetical protein
MIYRLQPETGSRAGETAIEMGRLDVNSVFKLRWQQGPAAVWIEGQTKELWRHKFANRCPTTLVTHLKLGWMCGPLLSRDRGSAGSMSPARLRARFGA